MRFPSLVILTALVVASPVFADADLEHEMKVATGKAVVKMIFGTHDEARAECEAGRTLLSANAPKYLAAYIEACVAMTVSAPGPQKKPESCPYYQRAIDTWRDNPPPKDDDEIALEYARKLAEWKDAVATNCPTAASAAAAGVAKMAPIPVPDGATVETLEGISYVLPGGWTVERFYKIGGNAFLKNDALQLSLAVQRTAASKVPDDFYTERETLSGGQPFEWVHKEQVKGSGYHVFYGRVKFDDAIVNIFLDSSATPSTVGVDTATALGIARRLAESIKLLGERRCIGDCGPGTIKPAI